MGRPSRIVQYILLCASIASCNIGLVIAINKGQGLWATTVLGMRKEHLHVTLFAHQGIKK